MPEGGLVPRVKHYFEKGRFYHITTRTEGGAYLLGSDTAKNIIVQAVSHYREHRRLRLFGFVVMSNHFHMVVQDTGADLSQTLAALKRWTAGRLTQHGALREGVWERRFDDNAVLDSRELRTVIEYDHLNPVRACLVARAEDYFWSSARNYANLSPVAMEIDKGW